eukprot:TRINITY_DN9522_c0_g1_i2.p3 TRINITY_DN9522_c0_g1~~TRINITY_DN9522_c0_g1_i2.p3  ORF type:complete len:171 (-),score=44.67 TRINITY_DN9522_c0_g1_i2:625-1137(-)
MIRRPPRSTLSSSSAASDVYKRQVSTQSTWDIKDEFAKYFLSNFQKRDVIIHRGYWSRVAIMRDIAEQFLKAADKEKKQVISLGSGYDTLFFNMKDKYPEITNNLHYYEIDLPTVIQAKIKKIKQSKELQQHIKEYTNAQHGSEDDFLHCADYTVFYLQYLQIIRIVSNA